MQLLSDWRVILRRAWSVRLMIAAAVLSAIEVGLTFVREFYAVPAGLFAIASVVVTALALVARLLAQNPGGSDG